MHYCATTRNCSGTDGRMVCVLWTRPGVTDIILEKAGGGPRTKKSCKNERSFESTLKCILQHYQTFIGVTQFNWTQEICITKHCQGSCAAVGKEQEVGTETRSLKVEGEWE